jgi:hypothetical protein
MVGNVAADTRRRRIWRPHWAPSHEALAKFRFGLRNAVPVVHQVVQSRITWSEVSDLVVGRLNGGSAAAAEHVRATAVGAWKTLLVSDTPGYAQSITEFNCVDINRYSHQRSPAEAMEIHAREEGSS